MVGIGTGFNKDIEKSLRDFITVCTKTIVEKGSRDDPIKVVDAEIKEIELYLDMHNKHFENTRYKPFLNGLLETLHAFYETVGEDVRKGVNIKTAVSEQINKEMGHIWSVEDLVKASDEYKNLPYRV